MLTLRCPFCMAVATRYETRSNPTTNNLDIKDPTTGEWVQAVAKLRTAGGEDVKFIPEQMEVIEQIRTSLSSLTQIAKTLRDSQANEQAVSAQIDKLQETLSAISSSSVLIQNELDPIAASISLLTESVRNNAEATASLSNKLGNIPQSLSAIESAIADLATIPELLKNKPATTKFSTVVTLTPNIEMPVSLPKGVKTLYFSARKNELGQSFDVRHSLKAGEVTVATGKYETLWAYSEFRESDLYLTDTTLYLASSSAITVEIHAWL